VRMGGVMAMITRDRFVGLWHVLSLLGGSIEATPFRHSTVLGAANHQGCGNATAPE